MRACTRGHSPGRGEVAYLGDRTAFDVYLEHTTPDGGEGFIGIEVKCHENLEVGPAANRARTDEVARNAGIFAEPSSDELRRPPLQQVWFDHLLDRRTFQHTTIEKSAALQVTCARPWVAASTHHYLDYARVQTVT